jgi:hypothetical protein
MTRSASSAPAASATLAAALLARSSFLRFYSGRLHVPYNYKTGSIS